QALEEIRPSDLTWKDPEASMVLSDTSDIPKENMKCDVRHSIVAKCAEFVNNFTNPNASRAMRNISHNNNWKESGAELVKVTDRILSTL
ncbi:21588_t:CDS:2, partial [Gigaspora rosea]